MDEPRRKPEADPTLVTVYRSQGMLGALLVKGKLESAGLPVLLRYEALGQIIGLTVDGLGLVEVRVPQDLEDEARALLDETAADETPDEAEDG